MKAFRSCFSKNISAGRRAQLGNGDVGHAYDDREEKNENSQAKAEINSKDEDRNEGAHPDPEVDFRELPELWKLMELDEHSAEIDSDYTSQQCLRQGSKSLERVSEIWAEQKDRSTHFFGDRSTASLRKKSADFEPWL